MKLLIFTLGAHHREGTAEKTKRSKHGHEEQKRKAVRFDVLPTEKQCVRRYRDMGVGDKLPGCVALFWNCVFLPFSNLDLNVQ